LRLGLEFSRSFGYLHWRGGGRGWVAADGQTDASAHGGILRDRVGRGGAQCRLAGLQVGDALGPLRTRGELTGRRARGKRTQSVGVAMSAGRGARGSGMSSIRYVRAVDWDKGELGGRCTRVNARRRGGWRGVPPIELRTQQGSGIRCERWVAK